MYLTERTEDIIYFFCEETEVILKKQLYELICQSNIMEFILLDNFDEPDDVLNEYHDFKFTFISEYLKESEEFQEGVKLISSEMMITKEEAEIEAVDNMYLSLYIHYHELYKEFVYDFCLENHMFVTSIPEDFMGFTEEDKKLSTAVYFNSPIKGCW